MERGELRAIDACMICLCRCSDGIDTFYLILCSRIFVRVSARCPLKGMVVIALM